MVNPLFELNLPSTKKDCHNLMVKLQRTPYLNKVITNNKNLSF